MPRPIRNAANATETAANWVSYLISQIVGDGLELSLVLGGKEIPIKLKVRIPEGPGAPADEPSKTEEVLP